jgi:hypothetical protein
MKLDQNRFAADIQPLVKAHNDLVALVEEKLTDEPAAASGKKSTASGKKSTASGKKSQASAPKLAPEG